MEKEIKLFDMDSLEYRGSICILGRDWEYRNVDYPFLVQTTTGMPLKTALACLTAFNLVYDIIEG